VDQGKKGGDPDRRVPIVLVVDDDEDTREALGEAIELEGYEVRKAGEGAEAIGRMLVATPDLVLLDLMMPGVNGWQVLERMEGDPRLARIPVFIVTAVPNVSGVRTGYPIFTKPLHLPRMMRTIRAFLSPSKSG
jgi:CheY-like chemotaxis protein